MILSHVKHVLNPTEQLIS